MAKIPNDKYYTPSDIAEYCVNKTREILKDVEITEWLEPSAGAGAFLPFLTDKPLKAYDLLPDAEGIEQADYLKLDLEYKKGRVTIGNPPFGSGGGNAMFAFIKKSLSISDYVAFILPVSQYNNDCKIKKGILIHSEILPNVKYSGYNVACCFNIYKRGKNENKKYTLPEGIIVKEYRAREINGKINPPLESEKNIVRLCEWGAAVGVVNGKHQYAHECLIICKNDKQKQIIIDLANKYIKDYCSRNSANKPFYLYVHHIKHFLHDYIDVIDSSDDVIGDGIQFERIRRITGYLVGTIDRFNNAKANEVRDRVVHSNCCK